MNHSCSRSATSGETPQRKEASELVRLPTTSCSIWLTSELPGFAYHQSPSTKLRLAASHVDSVLHARFLVDMIDQTLSLGALHIRVLQSLEQAVGESDGWAWKNTDLAIQMHDVLTRLHHWGKSVQWLANEFCEAQTEVSEAQSQSDSKTRELLDLLEFERPYLSGVLTSCLEDIEDTTSILRDLEKCPPAGTQ